MKLTNEQQRIETDKRIVGFKIHFVVYSLILPVNWIIWYYTTSAYVWPIWPTLGWTLGIVFHSLCAFHIEKFFHYTKEYEDHLKRLLKAKQDRFNSSNYER